jgi:hypothetical protein
MLFIFARSLNSLCAIHVCFVNLLCVLMRGNCASVVCVRVIELPVYESKHKTLALATYVATWHRFLRMSGTVIEFHIPNPPLFTKHTLNFTLFARILSSHVTYM